MKKVYILFFFVFSVLSHTAFGQDRTFSGTVVNKSGEVLSYATAVLLDPVDSTLLYYGITNGEGHFDIRGIENGNYLLQVAFVGYKPLYMEVTMPGASNRSPVLVLEETRINLDEVEVVGEAVPLMIKGDTVEYNRAAYRVKEGAVVEDLLRKLPGIEVDRAGNIKAMGEDVNEVYVDGKEFFGSDPKMATKNLPADAVDKVQMYDKKSDDSEFTGIDDGSHEKALNIVLDKDMKNILFGSVSGGGGFPSVYEGAARVFYRTDRINTAAIGMLNNTSNPGFSLSDYMNFNGSSIGIGGGSFSLTLGGDNSLPVNFGQPVYGLNNSAAGGLNFSCAKDKYNRIYFSYLGSGSGRSLQETVYSRNYTASSSFEQHIVSEEDRTDSSHMFSFGLERRLDTLTRISFLTTADLKYGSTTDQSTSDAYSDEVPVNSLYTESFNRNKTRGISGEGSLTRMLVKGRTVVKLNAKGSYSQKQADDIVGNHSVFYSPDKEIMEELFRIDLTDQYDYYTKLAVVQKAGKLLFLEPSVKLKGSVEGLVRSQGNMTVPSGEIDSLSPDARLYTKAVIPGLGFRRNGEKARIHVQLEYEAGNFSGKVDNTTTSSRAFQFLLPAADFEYEFASGKRLSLFYSTEINIPASGQLFPLVNSLSPLFILNGNPGLEPEKIHRSFVTLLFFDQFSLTNFFLTVSGDYTRNKINWSRMIDEQLVQTLLPVNVDYGLSLQGNVNFSRPIRKAGIKMSLSLQEIYRKSIVPVNGTDNVYSSLTHDLSLSLENRKKKKWDIVSGIGLNLTDSRYSLMEDLNDRFIDFNWFSDLTYTPGKKLDFSFSADVLNYNQQSFSEAVFVPYLEAEVNFHFLTAQRGTLSLRVHDILNRDTGVERYSDLNYLTEVRRNMLGRFVLLTFRYRLNKGQAGNNGIDVKIR